MVALIEKMSRDGGATREAVRKETAKPKPGRPKAYVFSYKAPTKAFKLQLRFTKSRVDRDEVISALQEIIKELRNQSSVSHPVRQSRLTGKIREALSYIDTGRFLVNITLIIRPMEKPN